VISPEEAGIERAPLNVVTGGDPAENAARLRKLLSGRGAPAESDITILNTAALLHTAGKAASLKEAADQARDVLFSGEAASVLDRYIEASRA
jgi:anthranilate phosphoribosyltransferase